MADNCMIYNYSLKNFQSFKELTQVNLTVTKKIELTRWMHQTKQDERVSKLMAVLGPNGGGKTVLLKSLVFLGWFTNDSFQNAPDSLIPIAPHFSAEHRPTEFSVLFDHGDKLYKYELRCTQERVLFEALYQKRGRFGYVFVREWNDAKKYYDIKLQDFDFNLQEALKVRQNASLISTAAQYGVQLAKNCALRLIVSNINIAGCLPVVDCTITSAAKYFSISKNQFQQMAQLLSSWDLGLSGIELLEKETNFPSGSQKIWLPLGLHKSNKKEYKLLFSDESNGTRTAFCLLSLLLPVLEKGGVAIIDELENDLHPHMLEPILDLFANPNTNPHNAQLLFSCHAAEILNLVHKSQIMLVQKNDHCESMACRLDAVEGIRSDDNFYAKYMAGHYGAIPNI